MFQRTLHKSFTNTPQSNWDFTFKHFHQLNLLSDIPPSGKKPIDYIFLTLAEGHMLKLSNKQNNLALLQGLLNLSKASCYI